MDLIHTLNRGVDKRKIFLDDQDRFRFIHDLYEFNNQEPASNIWWNFNRPSDPSDIVSHYNKSKRKLVVDIHTFCLMPNHYHLLLSSRVKGGISLFMRKLNVGYAKYFNQKYKRTGALFEGRYKSVPITEEAHFIHIPYYIHLNPLDLCTPEWRKQKVADPVKAINFLENYRWSSYLDYIGKQNFPSVTNRSFLTKFFQGKKNYHKETINWIKEMDHSELKKLTLE